MAMGGGGISSRTFDRMIGIMVTIASGLALIAARQWFKALLDRNKKKRDAGDEVHRTRYNKANTIQHMGACHCQRIRFRVRAPRVINAVDLPSKIRFPRISVPCDFFEPLTDEAIMSLYAVKTDETGMGVHTFCSYCGVHILYSPSVEPTEVQINVDCLDRSTIEHIYVSYLATPDSLPCPVTYEAARPFNRRGAGSLYMPILSSLYSPASSKSGGSQQGSGYKASSRQQHQQHQQQQQPGSDFKGFSASSLSGMTGGYDFNPAIWGNAQQSFSGGLMSSGGPVHKQAHLGNGNGSGNNSNALSAYYLGLQGSEYGSSSSQSNNAHGQSSSFGNSNSNYGGTAVGDDTPQAQADGLFAWGLGNVNAYVAGLDVDRYHHTLSPTPRKLRGEREPVRPALAALPSNANNWTPQYRQLRNHLAQYLPPHLGNSNGHSNANGGGGGGGGFHGNGQQMSGSPPMSGGLTGAMAMEGHSHSRVSEVSSN